MPPGRPAARRPATLRRNSFSVMHIRPPGRLARRRGGDISRRGGSRCLAARFDPCRVGLGIAPGRLTRRGGGSSGASLPPRSAVMLVVTGGEQLGAEEQAGEAAQAGHQRVQGEPLGLSELPGLGLGAAEVALAGLLPRDQRPQRAAADVLAPYLLALPDFAHIIATGVPGHFCATPARLRRFLYTSIDDPPPKRCSAVRGFLPFP